MKRLVGFNTDGRTNRIDEYEIYNQMRQNKYAAEDRKYAQKMDWLYLAFAVYFIGIVYLLTL